MSDCSYCLASMEQLIENKFECVYYFYRFLCHCQGRKLTYCAEIYKLHTFLGRLVDPLSAGSHSPCVFSVAGEVAFVSDQSVVFGVPNLTIQMTATLMLTLVVYTKK